MEYPLAHQFPPPGVVFGRVRPALAVVGLRPVAGIRLRMDRQRFRHEADLYERLGAGSDVRVEDTVDDGPVVNRAAGSVFGVGVGRAPFERGSAVPSAEQVVHSDIDRRRAQTGKLTNQLGTILHVGVVRLVVTEIGKDGAERTQAGPAINPNGRLTLGPNQRRHHGREENRCASHGNIKRTKDTGGLRWLRKRSAAD